MGSKVLLPQGKCGRCSDRRKRKEGSDEHLPGPISGTAKAYIPTVVFGRTSGLRMLSALIIKLGSWVVTDKGLFQESETS